MSSQRTFTLREGVKQTLEAALKGPAVDELVTRMREQVASGTIDEQTRDVLVALGWITIRDPRVIPNQRRTRPVRPSLGLVEPEEAEA